MGEILHKTISQTDTVNKPAAIAAETLLVHYSFELSHATATELVNHWLESYPSRWLRLAIIEALYQGRYKSISVEQILVCWHRRSKPIYHFNLEFEQLICSQLPGVNLDEREGIQVNATVDHSRAKEKNLKPSRESSPEASLQSSTNNPKITPINTNSNSFDSKEQVFPSEPGASGESEPTASQETSSASLTDAIEDHRPVNSNPIASDSTAPCEIVEENYPEKLSEQPLSDHQIKSEIIAELLQDPWLDDSDKETLENLIDSQLNNQMPFDFDQDKAEMTNSTSENHPSDSLGQVPDSPIHEFTPSIEEASEFYARLKAIVDNKLKHPEESRPMRKHK
jgi:hypothetical protein